MSLPPVFIGSSSPSSPSSSSSSSSIPSSSHLQNQNLYGYTRSGLEDFVRIGRVINNKLEKANQAKSTQSLYLTAKFHVPRQGWAELEMICKQKLKLKKKKGFWEVRSENKLKQLGEWFGKSFFFFLDELDFKKGFSFILLSLFLSFSFSLSLFLSFSLSLFLSFSDIGLRPPSLFSVSLSLP